MPKIILILAAPVQCLAGYYHMICGHLLDENYKWGVLVNKLITPILNFHHNQHYCLSLLLHNNDSMQA